MHPAVALMLLASAGAASHAGSEPEGWTMHTGACSGPGEGRYMLSFEATRGDRAEVALQGAARCPEFTYSVDYTDVPMEKQPDGAWLFDSPPWRLLLNAHGRLVQFDDWNDFAGEPIQFQGKP